MVKFMLCQLKNKCVLKESLKRCKNHLKGAVPACYIGDELSIEKNNNTKEFVLATLL